MQNKKMDGIVPTLIAGTSVLMTIATIVLLLTGCGHTEPIYIARNNVTVMQYNNKRGDLIIVPLNTNECVGYKKPYHIVTYNK